MAARTHSYTPAAPSTGPSPARATLAILLGLVGVLAVPVAIELTRKIAGADLLDAAWAVPVAAVASVAALALVWGARLSGLFTLARGLAIAGICFTLSSALAVGVYETLLRWK